jgi:hypothetical protein
MALQRFIIERDVSGVGSLDLGAVSKSKEVMRELGPDIQWAQTYVAATRHTAYTWQATKPSFRKHAELAGVPATRIMRVGTIIDPTT